MTLDTRFAVLAVWGLGTVVVYGYVLMRRRRLWLRRRSREDAHELLASVALFITALASALAIGFVLFGPVGTGIRGLFTALALGAFSAAGLVMASDKDLR